MKPYIITFLFFIDILILSITIVLLLSIEGSLQFKKCNNFIPIYYTDTAYTIYCIETDKIYRLQEWVEPTFIERRHIKNALK